MTPEQIAAKEAETAAAKKAEADAKAQADEKAKADEALRNKKPTRTRLEKLRHTKASIDAQIAEEEANNGIIIGDDDEDDDKPLTKGDLKRMQKNEAKKTALNLANDLTDDEEREKVTELLETRILPSGNPQKDLDLALAAVRSEKNQQIAAEIARKKSNSSSRSSGTGAPLKEEDQFVPTEDELAAARMVGKKTPADLKAFVMKARAKERKSYFESYYSILTLGI